MEFFERPQGATAGEVATALGTSRSTVTRRVRDGEATVFDSLTQVSSGQDAELLEERSKEDAAQ
jgi:transposase